MTIKYDYAVCIGRFQPFHCGHERVLKLASQQANKLIVVVGSSGRHRSPKNPFTYSERASMIHQAVSVRGLQTTCVHDHPYNDNGWVTEVREMVEEATQGDSRPYSELRICLVGFRKDSSSYYQGLFPEWDYVEVPSQYGTFNATDIRKQYFQDSPIVSEFLADPVRDFLKRFAFTEEFKWLLDETKYLKEYREEWGSGPFITVDAVCLQAGHILLVTRKDPPYRGALALPGGFLNRNERILDGMLRELREETHISDTKGEIPPKMLESFIKEVRVFDAPERSERGRIVTHAFKLECPNKTSGLYKVLGDDDAEKAQWYKLSDLRSDMFMDDHADIIQAMTGVAL